MIYDALDSPINDLNAASALRQLADWKETGEEPRTMSATNLRALAARMEQRAEGVES